MLHVSFPVDSVAVNFFIHHEYGYWHILLGLVVMLVKVHNPNRMPGSSKYSVQP